MSLRILSVVGARPQFIKAWPLSRALRQSGFQEFLLHTGQHYDYEMSRIFFDQLDIPAPDHNLEIGSGSHGVQTGRMLAEIEEVLLKRKPDAVLVYGDTNSTLAGALAAVKVHIPVAHVEAGLRSYNRRMPEEINRVMTDHLSRWLFAPGDSAVQNLEREGIREGAFNTGDVMADALLEASDRASERSRILHELGLREDEFVLATIHRAENTDQPDRFRSIMSALAKTDQTVVLPLHPRSAGLLRQLDLKPGPNIKQIDPVGYLDMIRLAQAARIIVTDSGGLQKEAYWLKTPCVTVRDETEWIETVECGWNRLTGASTRRILEAIETFVIPPSHPPFYGEGQTAKEIATILYKGLAN